MRNLVGRASNWILVGNLNNGGQFETYAIAASAGSKTISLNGAIAYLGKRGDLLTIMGFAVVDENAVTGWQPKGLVLGDANRRIVKQSGG